MSTVTSTTSASFIAAAMAAPTLVWAVPARGPVSQPATAASAREAIRTRVVIGRTFMGVLRGRTYRAISGGIGDETAWLSPPVD
jgi:hypothetical protein